MDEHCYLTSLSEEVVEKLLCEPGIHFCDLYSVSATCSKLWEICQNDSIWRYKFQIRWPDIYKKVKKKMPNGQWKETCMFGHHIIHQTRRLIKSISKSCYRIETEVSEDVYSEEFAPLIENELGLLLCIFELEKMIKGEFSDEDLTMKFYGQRVHLYLKHKFLEKKWKELLETYPCSSSIPGLEIGAVYLAQWFEPDSDIDVESVDEQITAIALNVQTELSHRYREHPAVTHQLQKKDNPVATSKWSPSECRAVLEAINYVLYKKLGFHGASGENNEIFDDPKNSFIHTVLSRKVGIPITLCILYAAVAYRLGVICLSVNCPAHFMLKFIEHPTLETEETFTYIDAFNDGRMTTRVQMGAYHPRRSQPSREPIKLVSVMERMCRNLINAGQQEDENIRGLNYTLRNSLELLVLLSPDDLESRIFLVRLYIHVNLNLTKALNHMSVVLESDPTSENIIMYMKDYAESQIQQRKNAKPKQVVKYRDKTEAHNVKYNVGSLMRHVKYDYKCVIHGWDPICVASKEWIQQMQIHQLKSKEHQPFYHVLVGDGSNRYAAQENLQFSNSPSHVTHWEVGKYFKRLNTEKGCYDPNEDLAKEYPMDINTGNVTGASSSHNHS